MKADLVVYDRNGQIILIAEIKKKTGVSAEWAAKWRRNMLSHGNMPDAKYFMIAMPDRFYIWENAGTDPEPAAPTFEIDAKQVLKPYLNDSGLSLEEISPQSFEFIVTSWLNSVLQTGEPLNHENKVINGIYKSGLPAAITGGYIRHEVAL